MKRNRSFNPKPMLFLAALFVVFCGFIWQQNQHTLYVIGDSTVRNSNKETWGWGTFIGGYFDTTKLKTSNQAMAGRSTRTFIKEGRWDKVLSTLKAGDFVMMQFGHNEGSVPDTTKAGYRGVLKGIGDETKELVWPDGKPETVHTYGWYLSKFVKEAKAKGATVFICSMIPRNEWADGKVKRANNDYGKWAQEVAQREGAFFIDLNKITADKYDKMGPDEVKKLFPGDHTHTSQEGAKINAQSVVDGLKELKNDPLKPYFL
ncbi:rhamnogalacturonan acetylesterase [Mucilaginibacter arboris]|uniref:GDSL family lipase n=1 Tax=Mucilaginibacter arboris TaxID=2682090 RepID=A0A7K1SU19_9SPHI|nr:rhamnogalacturonan acetylesterase [Mucilaginibacter arboris]MVN20811.1 GDSL family lipase [Mucilaginibacter arboris]